MTDIETLLARARQATGPDREIDYEIEALVAAPFLSENGYVRCEGDNGWYSSTPSVPGAEKIGPASAYTGSIDAVVGLIEAKLPGWTWSVISHDDGRRTAKPTASLQFDDDDSDEYASGDGATVPLALVCAFLQAWESLK